MSAERIKQLHRVIERSLFHKESSIEYQRTEEAVVLLSRLVFEFDGDNEIINTIESTGNTGVLDLLVGSYHFFADYHEGQSSSSYGALCSIGSVVRNANTLGDEETTEHSVYQAWETLEGLSRGQF